MRHSVLRLIMSVVLACQVATAPTASADELAGPGDHLADDAATPVLAWADCGDGFVCSTAAVPLDYHEAQGDQIQLAVIKLPAANPRHRIGTLFVNFGGPGVSGVDRLRARARWPWLFSDTLRERFDLVSWDPRSVSRSAPARCFESAGAQERYLGTPPPPLIDDAAAEQGIIEWSRDFAARCGARAGAILEHASSANTARDLEMLRRAVGDAELNYHGISYGTQVGAIYANLFPGRLRAMVLDGALDFEGNVNGHGSQGGTLPLNTRQGVPSGVRRTLDEFFRECAAAGPRCAFSSGDPATKWSALGSLLSTPLLVDGQLSTYPAIAAATLPKPAQYKQLAVMLQQLSETGSADAALLSKLTGGTPIPDPNPDDPAYADNRLEALYAIQCTDSTVPTDPTAFSQAADVADEQDPYFGRISAFDAAPCTFWPRRDLDRYTGPWNRPRSAPILVINTRYDPSTPLPGAVAGAEQLGNAEVAVVDGAGHTSQYVISSCIERVKRDYLLSRDLPPAGTTCPTDRSPFQSPPT